MINIVRDIVISVGPIPCLVTAYLYGTGWIWVAVRHDR